jgi:hypothetical protein
MIALPCNSDGSVAGDKIQLEANDFVEAVFELNMPVLVSSKYFVIVGDGIRNYLISED